MGEESEYQRLKEIALTEFSSVIKDAFVLRGPLNFPRCLRIILGDESFIDIRISGEKYSYHWERRKVDGKIFRSDNAPHYKNVNTYPKHFHKGSEENVVESELSSSHENAIREFLNFVNDFFKEN